MNVNVPPELYRFIRSEVARQVALITSGVAGDNSAVETETIEDMYPGMPSVTDRPVMHPAGFASRAVGGTISVTARQGAGPQNRIVLGHRDSNRPTDLEEGDACIYSSDGLRVLARVWCNGSTIVLENENGSVTIGDDESIGIENENGSISLAASGQITLEGPQGSIDIAPSGKIELKASDTGIDMTLGIDGKLKVANPTAELIAALVQLFTDVQGATAAGFPLVMPTFAVDLAKLQTFGP